MAFNEYKFKKGFWVPDTSLEDTLAILEGKGNYMPHKNALDEERAEKDKVPIEERLDPADKEDIDRFNSECCYKKKKKKNIFTKLAAAATLAGSMFFGGQAYSKPTGLEGVEYTSKQVFMRGNTNLDSERATVDIADAVYLLSYLFAGGYPPLCEKAADVNDDGKIDISDPISTLF